MAFSLNDYEIAAEIGQGGFASVFRARQKSLSREVAIKRLSPQRTQNAPEILRFRREAEAMASLTHDNIVSVFDYAFHEGSYYIVMEYVDGMTLETALDRDFPLECSLFALEKAASALMAAHEQEIIHRDVKPANILLGRNGQVKLADFGIALFRTGIETRTSCASPGAVLGTICYMAPEALVSPKNVDNRIDVFSLGCIVYQALADKLPFEGADFGEISHRLLNDEPAPLPSGTPARLAAMTMRCLAKDREKRPAMSELHEVLQTSIRGMYHESQEKLTAFVRKGCRQQSPAPVSQPTVPASDEQKRTLTRPLIAAAVLLAAAAVAVAAFLAYQSFSAKRPAASDLPVLPSLNTMTAPGEFPSETLPHPAPEAMITDGPAPMTGSGIGLKTGTLVLKGLDAKKGPDSVFLNGAPASAATQGGEQRFELAPGRYRLDIRRSGAPAFTRELELVPFERQVIDLRKGKNE
ncbi:MAG: serine/threonine protein kinase [Chitinispirillaceae bacterium]|nr:serine/threonine protein kinase [Chitinispirillaceae bacterium]